MMKLMQRILACALRYLEEMAKMSNVVALTLAEGLSVVVIRAVMMMSVSGFA
jgi:hypothetical protein